jgi:predicted ATPase
MITTLAIRNFKNLADIPTTPFGRLNVLIGPNGCGKSSLLQAIDFLRAFFMSSVEVYLHDRDWDYRDLPNLRQARKIIRWEVSTELDADGEGRFAGAYRYAVSLQPRKHLGIGEESLEWTPPGGQQTRLLIRKGRTYACNSALTGRAESGKVPRLPASIMSTWNSREDRKRYPEALHFRDWVQRFRSFLIWDPKVLRSPDRGKHDEIGPSGEHLAAIIGRMKDREPAAFRRLIARLKRLFPTLTDLSVSGQGWGWRTLRLHEGNGREIVFNSRQMSDGVLRLLAVTSLLYTERPPTVVMFEEPENGVHPQLIREVVQILRELTERKPPHRSQVFVTTHSPYVLDEFRDHHDEVFCMERSRPQAGATIVRLSEKRELDIARESFDGALGEAWFSGLLGANAQG